jgi:uncharacterized phiE125 gp8 family phage protein
MRSVRSQNYSYRFERTVDAASEPVTLSEVKDHLKIDGTDEDTYLTSLITASRQMLESELERSFITQTWKMYLPYFPLGEINIPKGKVLTVESVEYYDSNNSLQTVSTDEYKTSLGADIGKIKAVESWPLTNTDHPDAVVITFTAGYGASADDVPNGLKQALLILIADSHNFRQSYTKVKNSVLPNGKPFYQMYSDQYKIYY